MKAQVLWIFIPALFWGILLTSSCSKDSDSSSSVVASFTESDDSISAGDTVRFVSTSKNANYYVWDFGDGSASTVKTPSHIFSSNGVYTVKLIAIGNNSSDSASVNIVVGSTSIFPGKGITGVSLGDTWASINNSYGSVDTIHQVVYYSKYSEYLHEIYYYDKGLVFYFWSSDLTVSNTSQLVYLSIVAPYSGMTKKGILIGSSLSKVKSGYGSPSLTTGSNYNLYYYDSQGIGFYTEISSDVVAQMDIYSASASSSKISMTAQSMLTLESKRIPIYKAYKKSVK